MSIVFAPGSGKEVRLVGSIPLDEPFWCPATGKDANGLPICGYFIREVPVFDTVKKDAR